MNKLPEQPAVPAPTEVNATFRGYKEAYKTLRGLHPPISEEVRTDYLNRVRASPSSRYIAFRLLALRAVGEMQAKLTPFIPQLEEILFADAALLDLRQCDSVEAVGKSISERLAALQTKNDLAQFASARFHLPIVYGLIRVWDDPVRFQAGLDALAEAIDRLNKPKKPQRGKPSNNLEILARALIARVPEKPLLGKALPEMLKISQALFRQADATCCENLEFQSKLAKATTDIESLRVDLESETEVKKALQIQLAAFRTDVARLQAELAREKEHFETLKGHGEEDRKRAVGDAVARLRSELTRRVENIRLFADREQPNRQGIMNLLAEIGEILVEPEGAEK